MKRGFYYNTGSYFQWPVKLVGASFLFFGLVFLIDSSFGGGLLFIISGLISLTTNYFFFIDPGHKLYQDGVNVLGLRFGAKRKYQVVEYLFVKMNRVSRTYMSRIQSTTIADNEIDGYIRFSEHEKVHLFSDKNRVVVMKKLNHLSKALNVEIVDYTSEQVI